MVRILAVCGSLQRSSSNLSLLRSLAALGVDGGEGVEVSLSDALRRLPHFNLDLNAATLPPEVLAWRAELSAADALFVACPEYGHSLPGALKNAIDWVFASGELYRKPVAITALVGTPERGLRGLLALAQTLGALEAVVLGGVPIVRGPTQRDASAALLKELVDTVARVRAGEAPLPPTELPDLALRLVRGLALERMLLADLARAPATRRGACPVPSTQKALAALAERVAVSLNALPRVEEERFFERLDLALYASLPEERERLQRELLGPLVERVDATPALALLMDALGPAALDLLGASA